MSGNFWLVFLGAVAVLVIARELWATYTLRAVVLGRQAANMNWIANGAEKVNGVRNIRYRRGEIIVCVSFHNGDISLIAPPGTEKFHDFVELEHWLASKSLLGSPGHDF